VIGIAAAAAKPVLPLAMKVRQQGAWALIGWLKLSDVWLADMATSSPLMLLSS